MEQTKKLKLLEVQNFFEDYSNFLTCSEKEIIKNILSKIGCSDITQEQKDFSIELKNKGNEFYKEGSLDQALEMYTKSLEADPTNYVVYSNRALIYQKLNENNKAIDDCLRGIELEPSFVKFYIRLATIYTETDKVKASEYIHKGLSYEPDNQILLNMKEELSIAPSPFDSFDPSTMDALLNNKNLQSMVESFIKDKTPEELNDMVSKAFGSLNKMK